MINFFDLGKVKANSVGCFDHFKGLKCVGIRQSWGFVIIRGKMVKNRAFWAWVDLRRKSGTGVLQVFSGIIGGLCVNFWPKINSVKNDLPRSKGQQGKMGLKILVVRP